jgi:sugar/nucleoside kinase (ribokinase family)
VVSAHVTSRVVVVGDIAVDVVARYAGQLQFGSDTAARIAVSGGGSAANVAAWLASTGGVAAVFVGRVGADAAGRSAVDGLRALGVDVRVRVDDQLATGCVVVLVDDAGERTMLPDRGASAALAETDLPEDVFAGARHLHLSGYPLLHAGSRAAGLSALAIAVDNGLTVSVDPSSAAPLAAVGGAHFLEWTDGADLCIANLDEAVVLAGAGPPGELARRLAASAYREVVIKLGAAGALWSDGATVVSVDAEQAVVADTTGAGDAFAAGFLARWVAGAPPKEALSAGARLAARAVATSGARPV